MKKLQALAALLPDQHKAFTPVQPLTAEAIDMARASVQQVTPSPAAKAELARLGVTLTGAPALTHEDLLSARLDQLAQQHTLPTAQQAALLEASGAMPADVPELVALNVKGGEL